MDDYYERYSVFWASDIFDKFYDKLLTLNKISSQNKVNIFHYTTTEVLDKLLENATFFATNIFYLNDSEEYKSGIQSLEHFDIYKENKKFQKISFSDGKSFPGLYTISFSKESDSLHQWITYAKESGIAIELDYESLKQDWFVKQNITNNENVCEPLSNMKPVVYDTNIDITSSSSKIFEEVSKSVNDFMEGRQISDSSESETVFEILLRKLAAHIKNDKFSGEEEVRLALFPIRKGKNSKTIIKYLPINGILRPYIEVTFGKFENEQFLPCLPIKSILIGPSAKQQAVFNSVVHRMIYKKNCAYQYNDVDLATIFKQYCDIFINWYKNSTYYNREKEENILYIFKRKWYTKNEKYFKQLFGDSFFNLLDIEENKSNEKLDNLYLDSIEIFKTFSDNYYLTKEGVLIKKSETPYIF